MVVIMLFVVYTRKENFTIDGFKRRVANAIGKLSGSKTKLDTTGLTAAIYNVANKLPKPISPKAGFEELLGREAGDSAYTPGFYKIQTSFPPLITHQPRKFNLEG